MLRKNTAAGVYLYAVDTTASPVAGKTGDASNITGAWSKDGGAETSGFTTAHPTEIGGGIYWQPLTAAETNGDQLAYRWASSTSGIVVDPIFTPTYTPPRIVKNTALSAFTFAMYDETNINDLKSGLTPTVTLSIDGAAFSPATNSPAEIGSTGVYKIDLAAADLDGTVVTLMASATGALTTLLEIITQP